jgi:MFS family permease
VLSLRPRTALAQLTPPVRRILVHSLLLGFAGSIADLLFNFYLVSLGYAADTAGLLATVSRVAGVVLGLPIGVLIDRAGARRALLVGVALYAGGWALKLLSGSLWALSAAEFLAGAALLLAQTAVVPLLARVTTAAQRPAVFGLNAAAALMIGLVGSAVGGVLPALAAAAIGSGPQDVGAYRLALTSVVVLGLAAAVPLLKDLPDSGRDTAAAAQASMGRLRSSRLLFYAVPSLLLGAGGGLILPFQNLFFRERFGLSDAAVGAVLAWTALGMGIGAMLGAPASARLGMRRAAALLRLGAVPAMLLMIVPALPVAVAGFFLRGLFVAASYPLNDALVMQATPERQRGLMVSLMTIFWSLGMATASVASGWAQVHWGFGPVLVVGAVAYALSGWAIALARTENVKRKT